jgi:hypothetical protein
VLFFLFIAAFFCVEIARRRAQRNLKPARSDLLAQHRLWTALT